MDFKTICDSLEEIKQQLASFKARTTVPQPSRSTELKELFTALAKAQSEMRTAGLNAENPYFKSAYADLAEIIRVSRPALSKNGLSVMHQILTNEDGQNMIHCILAHISGQWIESRMRILPVKNDVQSMASYISYLKRYTYAALIGVVSSDEDDDGEKAVHDSRHDSDKGVALNTKYNPRESSYETITKEQLQELDYELSEYPDIAEQILNGLKLQSLADMPRSKYMMAIKRIREIKILRNNGK